MATGTMRNEYAIASCRASGNDRTDRRAAPAWLFAARRLAYPEGIPAGLILMRACCHPTGRFRMADQPPGIAEQPQFPVRA